MSGYGSRRRVLVVALMVGALSTGVGFVVLSGGWQPIPAGATDAQGPPPLLSRVPCVAGPGGLPCVAGGPDRPRPSALATTASGQAAAPGARSGDDSVVAADPGEPVLVDDSAAKETDPNVVQPVLLVARSTGGGGSSYPGGAGAASAGSGSGAGNGSLGSRARGSNESLGMANGANASSSSSTTPSSPGVASGASTASSAQTSGTAPGTPAVLPDVPPVAAGVVPPVFVEHHATVSDLTLGRSEAGTPISIVVGGAGEPMSSTPEPSSMLLIGTGVVGLGAFLKRRRAAGTTPPV